MTSLQIYNKIIWWEREMGEDFNDNFSHDKVNGICWAFYLLGRGLLNMQMQ